MVRVQNSVSFMKEAIGGVCIHGFDSMLGRGRKYEVISSVD